MDPPRDSPAWSRSCSASADDKSKLGHRAAVIILIFLQDDAESKREGAVYTASFIEKYSGPGTFERSVIIMMLAANIYDMSPAPVKKNAQAPLPLGLFHAGAARWHVVLTSQQLILSLLFKILPHLPPGIGAPLIHAPYSPALAVTGRKGILTE